MAGETILVVDDDTAILDMIEWILCDAGYHVKLAASGELALAMIGQAPPDLVLLDLMMPVINGWDVMRRLRSEPGTQRIPVIVISADRHVAAKTQEIKANDYLGKPFDIDELLAKVRQILP